MKKFKLLLITALAGFTGFAQTLDQQYAPSSPGGGGFTISPSQNMGQSFTCGLTGNLVQVNVRIGDYSNFVAGTFQIRIIQGNGYGGTVLNTTNFDVLTAPVSFNYQEQIVTLSSSVPVTAGNSYTIDFRGVSGTLTSHGANAGYADGGLYFNNGNTALYNSYDMWFKTFVSLPEPGKNLSFDGNNDMVDLDIGITDDINFSQQFTIEAWFNQAVPTGANNMCIVGNHENNTHVDLRIENDQLKAFIGFGAISVTAPGTISLNTWHHAAVTLDTQTLSLYLDGVLVASAPRAGFILPGSGTGYRIGADYFAGRMNGQIDEVRIFDAAKSAEFISRTMNCEIDPSTSDLIAYYKLNQGLAGSNNAGVTSATDATSNGYDGILSGFALNGPASNWLATSPVTSGDVIPEMPSVGNYQYCFNESAATLSASGTNLMWFTSATGGTGSSTAPTPSTSVAGTTSYWVASTNASGCESERAQIDVEVFEQATGVDTQIACGSFDWIDGNTYTSSNNTATYTIVGGSDYGCDSIVTLNLTINNGGTSVDTQTACGSFDWIDGNTYTSSNNTATYTYVGGSENGCDSIVTLNLTILTVPTVSATDNGDATITASTANSYQWINCATNQPIAGATSQTFTATANGNYAVVGTSQNGCSDTSACVMINNVGINESAFVNVAIAPNPTNNVVTVTFDAEQAQLIILDAQGKVMSTSTINNGTEVSLKEVEAGVYFFNISTATGSAVKRVVKN